MPLSVGARALPRLEDGARVAGSVRLASAQLLAGLAAAPAVAQLNTGTMTGTVTDESQGAPVGPR